MGRRKMRELILAKLGGPAQFAARPLLPLHPQQVLVRAPRRIAQPHPGEMKHLVDQNAGQLARLVSEFLIQNNLALADERSSENRIAVRPIGVQTPPIGCQRGLEAHSHHAPVERIEPA